MLHEPKATPQEIAAMCRHATDPTTVVVAVIGLRGCPTTLGQIYQACDARYSREELSPLLLQLSVSGCLSRTQIDRPIDVKTGPKRVWAYAPGEGFKRYREIYMPAGVRTLRQSQSSDSSLYAFCTH